MDFDRTAAAVSTAQGMGGIAVIRISGGEAIQIADRVFRPANGRKLASLPGYSASYGHIYNDGKKIDEVVATVFKAPHSYTGEDVVEISCHGGIFMTAQVLRAVLNAGAVPAQAGEFTRRAFLNGKLDLTEAEAIMELIEAKSETAARAALNLREGALSKRINEISGRLLDSAAHLSAWADYPDEGVEEISPEKLCEEFYEAIRELEEILSTYDGGQAVFEGIDTVIAGRPNVGKSTLMNLLSGREKSIVTEIAGTTRDIIEGTVILGDIVLKISDTAGLRETDDEIEKIGVDRARKRLENCGLIIAVFDSSRPLDSEDMKLLKYAEEAPFVAVINKTDLPVRADLEIIKKYTENYVEISASENRGIEDLRKIITKIAGADKFEPGEAILVNERQRIAANAALENLKEARDALIQGVTYDAVTVSLEDAISNLMELVGKNTADEVIDRVFHNFCVGK